MNDTWKNGPRVKAMHPDRIQLLSDLTERVEKTLKSQLLPKLLSIAMLASQSGISFNDQETGLLMSILSGHMNPADRGRLDTLKVLSKRTASKRWILNNTCHILEKHNPWFLKATDCVLI